MHSWWSLEWMGLIRPAAIALFATAYSMAFAIELGRGRLAPVSANGLSLGCVGLGLVLQTIYLTGRAVAASGPPLSSTQDWLLVGAWLLAAVYLYLASQHPRTAFGWILLPLVLGLVVGGWMLGDVRSVSRDRWGQIWAWIHAVSLLLATVAVLVAFASGVMYLLQSRRLRAKRSGWAGWRLPSLEWLHRTNSRATLAALLLLGVGILSGFVLNLWNLRQDRPVVPLSDPLVVTTLLMFGWLGGCVGMGWAYRPAREGRKVALMTLLTTIFLAVTLALFVFGRTQHNQLRQAERGPSGQGAPVRSLPAVPVSSPWQRGNVRQEPLWAGGLGQNLWATRQLVAPLRTAEFGAGGGLPQKQRQRALLLGVRSACGGQCLQE
jgi:ABC-type uncharacterized transport system permease subunit